MRRVRNQRIHTSNPSLLFARGVESIVSEQLQRQRHRDQDDLRSSKPVTIKLEPRGNFLSLLMRQFANY
ncbi:hypothetical protein N8198_07565 [Gammaproteobacteria bacterium]|nr:hypothetical protein [Gammaproteobacteria bacterium]